MMAYKEEAIAKNAEPETEKENAKAFDSTLQSYLAEVKKHPLLSREEQLEAIRKYQEWGDQEAKNLIIVSNLRLVIKIAFQYHNSTIYFSQIDLIQEGNKGLIRATEKYNPEKNVKFSYYAAFWIKAYILKYITDNWSIVKFVTSEPKRKLFSQLKKEKDRLKNLGVDPNAETIAENLKVKQKDIQEVESLLENGDLSLDSPLKEDGTSRHVDFLSSETNIEELIFKTELKEKGEAIIDEFRKTLSAREKAIFDQRIYCQEPLTLDKIGGQFGISRERVRQMEKDIKKKLHKFKNGGDVMRKQKEKLTDVTLAEVEAATKENTKSRKIALLYFGFKNGKGVLSGQDIAEEVGCSANYVSAVSGQVRHKIKQMRKSRPEQNPARTKEETTPKAKSNDRTEQKKENEPIHLLVQRGDKKFEMKISGGTLYDLLVQNLGL